jgi:hypothetical protein
LGLDLTHITLESSADDVGVYNTQSQINKKAENIGYFPIYSSKDCIVEETKEILKNIYKNL